jgi:hypothetical protein
VFGPCGLVYSFPIPRPLLAIGICPGLMPPASGICRAFGAGADRNDGTWACAWEIWGWFWGENPIPAAAYVLAVARACGGGGVCVCGGGQLILPTTFNENMFHPFTLSSGIEPKSSPDEQ